MTLRSPNRGVPASFFTGLTTGSGVFAIPPGFRQHTITLKTSNGTVSAGAVQVEASDDSDFAGTWAPVGGGPITPIQNSEQQVQFEGTYRFVRVRISTNLTGGATLGATYQGN